MIDRAAGGLASICIRPALASGCRLGLGAPNQSIGGRGGDNLHLMVIWRRPAGLALVARRVCPARAGPNFRRAALARVWRARATSGAPVRVRARARLLIVHTCGPNSNGRPGAPPVGQLRSAWQRRHCLLAGHAESRADTREPWRD